MYSHYCCYFFSSSMSQLKHRIDLLPVSVAKFDAFDHFYGEIFVRPHLQRHGAFRLGISTEHLGDRGPAVRVARAGSEVKGGVAQKHLPKIALP